MCGSKCEFFNWKMQTFSGEGRALPRPLLIMRRGHPLLKLLPSMWETSNFFHSSPYQPILDPSLVSRIRDPTIFHSQLCRRPLKVSSILKSKIWQPYPSRSVHAMPWLLARHSPTPMTEYYAVIQRAQCWWATTCGCRDEDSNPSHPGSEMSTLYR